MKANNCDSKHLHGRERRAQGFAKTEKQMIKGLEGADNTRHCVDNTDITLVSAVPGPRENFRFAIEAADWPPVIDGGR